MSLKHELLILGSRNAKEADQELSRDEIKPVQILTQKGEIQTVDFFNDWGRVGVSSIVFHPTLKNTLFVSINDEIRKLDVEMRQYSVLDIPHVADIHDLHFHDDVLWISNTEYDEAIAYDVFTNKVKERISLEQYRVKLDQLEEGAEKVKDRFHCNQVFKDHNGDLCVLIHHISGWQFYKVVFEMLVRRQGDGGVINLKTGEIHQLKLQSPHSVRLVKGQYWIQDSTDHSTKIFNKEWELLDSVDNGGFGRGMDFSDDEDIAYIGISATRKRYLRVIPVGGKHNNRVLVLDISSKKELDSFSVPNIEQVDNVYILDGYLKEMISKLID